jgi:hypothetical protein
VNCTVTVLPLGITSHIPPPPTRIKVFKREIHHCDYQISGYHSIELSRVNALLGSKLYRMSQEERSIFWEVIVSVILSKKMYIYICTIPKGFQDITISLYNSKIVDKKEILRTVSNTGIYCSSDKVVTVYPV